MFSLLRGFAFLRDLSCCVFSSLLQILANEPKGVSSVRCIAVVRLMTEALVQSLYTYVSRDSGVRGLFKEVVFPKGIQSEIFASPMDEREKEFFLLSSRHLRSSCMPSCWKR